MDTWRHRPCDHSTPHNRLLPTYWWSFGTNPVPPAVFEILASKSIGSRPWPFRVTWRHRTRDGSFAIGGPCTQVSISNGFRDIKHQTSNIICS